MGFDVPKLRGNGITGEEVGMLDLDIRDHLPLSGDVTQGGLDGGLIVLKVFFCEAVKLEYSPP